MGQTSTGQQLLMTRSRVGWCCGLDPHPSPPCHVRSRFASILPFSVFRVCPQAPSSTQCQSCSHCERLVAFPGPIGIHVTGNNGGVHVDGTDVIGLGIGLLLDTSNGQGSNREIFVTHATFDSVRDNVTVSCIRIWLVNMFFAAPSNLAACSWCWRTRRAHSMRS